MLNLLDLVRKEVIAEGRAMIRVIYRDTKEITTAAVCPGCWNSKSRRFTLIKRMDLLNVQVVSKNDKVDGVYLKNQKHVLECPYNDEIDPWLKMTLQARRKKRLGIK